jgi:hypothetical protein
MALTLRLDVFAKANHHLDLDRQLGCSAFEGAFGDIVRHTIKLEHDPTRPGEYRPQLVTVEGTSHSSLQNAILYKEAPKKEAFTCSIGRNTKPKIDPLNKKMPIEKKRIDRRM